MPTVAKYDVVSEERVSLGEGEAHDFPLETPGIRADIRTLLSFMVVPGSTLVDFRIVIANSSGIHEIGSGARSLAGDMGAGMRVLQIVIRTGILQKSGNTLRIEVTEGEGVFSDIVLWYQTEA